MKSSFIKTIFREIKGSLGRYIAILAIVALGVGFFAGLKVTRPAMIDTANNYINEHNMFDYQLISTLGFVNDDIDAISKVPSVDNAQGSISADLLFTTDENMDKVLRAHSITHGINSLQLDEGSLPQSSNECVVDSTVFSSKDIGTKITLSKNNSKETLDMFANNQYTIVGLATSPYYLNYERGSSSLGNGSVTGFMYINDDGFDTDYFTEIFVNLKDDHTIYSKEYKDAVDLAEDDLTVACENRADIRYNKIITKSENKFSEGQQKYNKNYNKYISSKSSAETKLKDALDKINSGEKNIKKQEKSLLDNEKKLLASKSEITVGFTELTKQQKSFEENKPYMTPEQIAEASAKLAAAEKNLNDSANQVNAGLKQISQGKIDIKNGKATLVESRNQYNDSKTTATEEFADAKNKLDKAKVKLNNARKDIKDIESPSCYVLNRDTNIGYACFENDSNIIDGIAKVFPIFFFMVAALVCMTTMTRMVDEQRTQIGVLKALGYSNLKIMGKYLFYSGSAALIGSSVGFLSGCYIFPTVIWKAYGMMYNFNSTLTFMFDWPKALIALAVALICSMGATWFSCYGELKIVPAQLIRPKSPKNGKRILLERIPFIWKKISFLYKVSLRNIFRYKKRFFMMVLGISGCTALLLTGLGVRDSIKNVVDYQYDEIITYDYSVMFNEDQGDLNQSIFRIETQSHVKDCMFAYEGSVDLVVGNKVKSTKIVIADDSNFHNFIDLHTEKSPISYPEKGEVVICKKLAHDYKVKVGDTVSLRNSDLDSMNVKVSGICENYVYNYVYVSKDTCNSQWGYVPPYKTAYINSSYDSEEGIYQSSANVQGLEQVSGVSVNNDLRTRVAKMMKSLDYVIGLVILSAGALAFIVLYNLTNINITERIREIATIKVLGFYPNETSAYVFRENFFLTGISALVGLILGKLLHAFVMNQIQVDLMSFDVRISTASYIIAVVLTFVFAAIVAFVMYFKLQKVSMTESLKSIE